jgi:hypothetical protein
MFKTETKHDKIVKINVQKSAVEKEKTITKLFLREKARRTK